MPAAATTTAPWSCAYATAARWSQAFWSWQASRSGAILAGWDMMPDSWPGSGLSASALATDGPSKPAFRGRLRTGLDPRCRRRCACATSLSPRSRAPSIEIGLAYASSALAIAEALVAIGSDKPRHVIIDAYQREYRGSGWEALVRAGLSHICLLIEERSQAALPMLWRDGFVADAAFVDGSHIFHNVFVDLFFLRELLRPGGLVVLDDCDYASVATAVRYFEVNTGWVREPVEGSRRLRAYRLPDPRLEPSFEAFRPFGSSAEADRARLPRPCPITTGAAGSSSAACSSVEWSCSQRRQVL